MEAQDMEALFGWLVVVVLASRVLEEGLLAGCPD